MQIYKSAFRLSFLFFLGFPILLFGQDSAIKNKRNLDSVVVTGQIRPILASESLYPVKVYGQKYIEQKGAINMADVLNTTLSTKILSDNVLGSVMILQGLTGQNIKMLLDGVPLLSGSSNEFDLRELTLSNVARIEMIQGPMSVQYGTNSLAGTVNIISKNLSDTQKLSGALSLYGETIGQYNASGWIGKSIHGWNMMLNGGYNNFTGFASKDYKTSVNNPMNEVRGTDWFPRQQFTGSLKIYRNWGAIRAGLQHYQFHEESPSKGDPDPSTSYLTANDYLYLTNRHNTSVYANGNINEHSRIDIVNSYNHYDNNNIHYWTNLQNNSRKRLDNSETAFRDFNFRGTYSRFNLGMNHWNMQLGYDVSLNKGAGQSIADTASTINDIGIFTTLGSQFGKHLSLQMALRYIYNSKYDAKDINLFNAKIPVIPSFQALWKFNDSWQARASYARAFRAPSLLELYRSFINSIHYIVGNTHLAPEIGDNYQLSLTWQKHYGANFFRANSLLFLNNLKNEISLVQLDASQLPTEFKSITVARTYANIPHFKTRGINLNFEYSHNSVWQILPSFGWLARNGTNSNSRWFNSYDISTEVRYQLPRPEITFSIFYKYNGSMAQFALDSNNAIQTRVLNDYSLMDGSASYTFHKKGLILTLGVKNIFNVVNVYQSGDGTVGLISRSGTNAYIPVSWGRTGFLKLTKSF